MKYLYMILIAGLFCTTAIAKKTPKADWLFERWDYFRAAELYKKAAAKHPDADLYFKLGECYRNMNLYKEEQSAYDKVDSMGIYGKPEFYLYYGLVLKSNGEYEKAKVAFNKYTELMPSDPRGNFYSASIDIVTEDHKTDEPILLNNIHVLNTKDADLSPVLYRDGIVFTSSRKQFGHEKIYTWTGGYYFDLYHAKRVTTDTNFTDISIFGNKQINKKFHNGPACFSNKFDTIYISRVEKFLKGSEKKSLNIEENKIFTSTIINDEWTKEMPFAYNSDSFSVAHPFLTPDGSRIYFVSNMPGGFGETDIYYCNWQNTGWSKPINMGPNINTFNREKFPSMDSTGNFYFSSDGYQGFGGLDICVARATNGAFEKAIPMKYPFNSFTDDFGIVFLKDEKTGYLTSNRVGGKGDDDIYYFDLYNANVDSSLLTSIYTIAYKRKTVDTIIALATMLKGTVTDKETGLPLCAKISIVDHTSNQSVATLNADSITGKYQIPLTVGRNYGISANMTGYLFYSHNFNVPVADSNQTIIHNIRLQKIEVGKNVILKNVFFDYDKFSLKDQSSFELNQIVKILMEHPTMKIELSGHTDSRGTDAYNKKLSQARAKACVDYLVSKGINLSRLTYKGYGKTRPLDTNKTEEGMANNRRTEFLIIHK